MSTSQSEYELGTSRLHVAWSLVLHAGAVAALALTRVEPGIVVALGLVLLAGFVTDVRRHATRCAGVAAKRLRVDRQGWRVTRRDGRTSEAMPLAAAWVFGDVVILRLGARPLRRHSVIVARDALSEVAFRQLRCAVTGALRSAAVR